MSEQPLHPITSTLIRRALVWAALCTVTFGGLQAWLAYENVQKNFQMTVQRMANTHVPLLSIGIWDIEPQAIQSQINLILQTPQIGHVTLRVGTGQQFDGGKPDALIQGAPLIFNIPPPNRPIGSIGTHRSLISSYGS